jgi:tetratricopeptide (TPR) repeat protein
MLSRTFALFFFLLPLASAQFNDPMASLNHRVLIHIHFPDGGDCDVSTKVELMKSASAAIAEGRTDRSCVVEFFGVPAGTYYLAISGRGFSGLETSQLTLTSPDTESLDVTIQPPESKNAEDTVLRSAYTSAADLGVPKKAAKEFNKANQEMEEREWNKAIFGLQKAIAIYPQYAAAYNNLGVIYARTGDRKRELESLQRAVSIDNQYVPAYVNMARMHLALGEFSSAESELKKAIALEPSDGASLVLLSYAAFMNHHLEDAVGDCSKVHGISGTPHAFAHWVAAFALEQQNKIAEAGSQFQLYVKEQPTGVRADAARKELANIANYLAGN